ncbi:hypothetical protein [Pedobacter antarcticus]|uniref:hypothetical protein n=1 Tax=Pedobacter antarcticus TaxID=34086 RepID=UPI001C573C31|nr:hypothetical protein [Pedobacter antarcticus]
MIKYRYTQHHDVSCTQEFCIHHINQDNQYVVELEGEVLGYLFVDGINTETGKPIWKGNTTILNLSADTLGSWIEKTDENEAV